MVSKRKIATFVLVAAILTAVVAVSTGAEAYETRSVTATGTDALSEVLPDSNSLTDSPTDDQSVPQDIEGDDLVQTLVTIDADSAVIEPGEQARFALPPGMTPEDFDGLLDQDVHSPAQVVEWRVDDGQPALRINFRAGADHGIANRFDPADMADDAGLPPMPLRIHRIHFMVNSEGEPTGSMEWHVWEDNGGHKADVKRDIVPPFVVTGAPGHNVIDLASVGRTVVIDPPRMFQVGYAAKTSEASTPDVLMDDGLPYVGGSGDFHGSLSGFSFPADLTTMYCGLDKWILLGFNYDDQTRSPAFMIWLEVEWLGPPESVYFDRIDGEGAPGGDFTNGSRIAWGDYDNDGDEDILASGSKLYRNDGDAGFADVTATSGITDTGAGGLWADYDNDGDLDFYQYTNRCVPCGQEDNFDDLWRNKGDGTFENVRAVDFGGDPNAPVPRDPLPTEGAAWGDFNNDGYIDLYAGNHVDWDSGTCFDDYLWLNNGPPDFTFRDVSEESGVQPLEPQCGRGVSPGDFDDDGDLDIFVSNYRLKPDQLWVNEGNDELGVPHFVDKAREHGVQGVEKSGNFAGAYGHTIGAAWGDLDRDGDQDLVAANLAHSAWRCFSDATMVYESEGPSGSYQFNDVRETSGVNYVETHSDPSVIDFDNDGFLDLHLTHVYDGWRTSLYRNTTGDPTVPNPSTVFMPVAMRGHAGMEGALLEMPVDGSVASITHEMPIRFDDVTHVSGIYPRTSWGSGWSDFDNDGDLDLAARGLWRNRTSQDSGARYLQVELRGCGLSNRDAIGSRAVLQTTYPGNWGGLSQEQRVIGARGTGSQDSRVLQFGLGTLQVPERLTVTFPSGQQHVLDAPEANRRETVVELGAIIRPSAWQVTVGAEVGLHADTCGASRDLAWDLDGDGTFDDGTGEDVTWLPDAIGTHEVFVQVTDGEGSVVAKASIEVE